MSRLAAVAALLLCAACSRDSKAPPPAHDAAAARPAGSPFETFETTAPRPGDVAPDFALVDTEGQTVELSDATARGPVVLVFGSFT